MWAKCRRRHSRDKNNITLRHHHSALINRIRAQVNHIRAQVNHIQAQVNHIQPHANHVRAQVNHFRARVNHIRTRVQHLWLKIFLNLTPRSKLCQIIQKRFQKLQICSKFYLIGKRQKASTGHGIQQPVKPQQIQVVIEEPKKQPKEQPVKQFINHVELEFKPTKLQCPHCKQTVSFLIMNDILRFIYLIYYYPIINFDFQKGGHRCELWNWWWR